MSSTVGQPGAHWRWRRSTRARGAARTPLFTAAGRNVTVPFSPVCSPTPSNVTARARGYAPERQARATVRELGAAAWGGIWALLFPVFLLVGLRFGVFTPSEIGAFAVVYAVAVGLLAYRKLHRAGFAEALEGSLLDVGAVMFLIALSAIFGYGIVFERIPEVISGALLGLTDNAQVVLVLVVLFILLAGCFIDGTVLIIMLTPIFLPLVRELGVDPVHFGLVFIIAATIGNFTPPVGSAMYAVCSILRCPVGEYTRESLPFLLVGGALLGGVTGHLAGRVLPKADLAEVADALPLGSSAYVALVDHDDARRLEELFADREARVVSTGLTTPDPVTLQAAFRRFADDGMTACAIEASSIGIVEQRLAATRIEVAVFTNFTRDHLDFHGGMAAYWEAKARLFDWPGLRAAVLNVDDEQGASLARRLDGSALDVWTFSAEAHHAARLQARHLHYRDGGLAFTLNEGAHAVAVQTSLIGDYNASNVLAVIGALRALGVSLVDAAAACTSLTPVPGRMQRVAGATDGPEVVVDYAHTPDALEKALAALRPLARERGGRLWVVFGCGGNRDATKRPLMGAIAARAADQVVVTSDNPRHEPPADILRQIADGMDADAQAVVIEDRRAAIVHAVRSAGHRDVILLAGKGHEPEQEIAGVKYPFSDLDEARNVLAGRPA